MTTETMNKLASELYIGDQMRAPQHERKWLGNRLCTVKTVEDGAPDKVGRWLLVRLTFQSPYAPENAPHSEMVVRIRPETRVRTYYGIPFETTISHTS